MDGMPMETVIVEQERLLEAGAAPPPKSCQHDPPVPGRQLVGPGRHTCPGLDLVQLWSRYVSLDGALVVSVFQAPDAEIVRRGMRFLEISGYRTVRIWTSRR